MDTEVKKDIQNGLILQEVAQKHALSYSKVYKLAREMGWKKTDRKFTKLGRYHRRNKKIIAEYQAGASQSDLGKKYNLKRQRIAQILNYSSRLNG